MPTVQQLRYLAAIADTLNFSRAAEICHVTQPTLSLQLKQLEARLGIRLVERTRARVILTPAGAEIARRARIIAAEVEDIRDIARRDDPDAVQSLLRMGVVQTVGAYVLSVSMPEIRKTFGDMRIHIREDRLDTLPAQLSEGIHDVILLPEPAPREGFDSTCLLHEPLHVVLPKGHRLAHRQAIDPTDLAGETILTMDRGHRLTDQTARLCHEVGAIHSTDYVGTTLDTLRQMVATGMGISLLPALYIRSEVVREELVVARPLTCRVPVREITMAWRSLSPRAKTYATLADTIRTCLQPWDAISVRPSAP